MLYLMPCHEIIEEHAHAHAAHHYRAVCMLEVNGVALAFEAGGGHPDLPILKQTKIARLVRPCSEVSGGVNAVGAPPHGPSPVGPGPVLRHLQDGQRQRKGGSL